MDNRGVSNTLGYVLLFGVVFTSIAAVGTVGIDTLETARDGTMKQNAEHTMTGIASAVEDVHRENVSRTSRVDLGTGTLGPGSESTITVDVGGATPVDAEPLDPIVYRIGDTRLVYEAGAVFLIQRGGGRVVREPTYLFDDDDGYVVPVIRTDGPGGSVAGSNAQVLMQPAGGETSTSSASSSDAVTVTIETTERRAPMWEEVLDAEGGDCSVSPPPPADTARCEFSPSSSVSVVVHETVVRYQLAT